MRQRLDARGGVRWSVHGCGGVGGRVGRGSAAFAITVNGSLTGSDRQQTGRVFRDGLASSCAASKAYPGTVRGTFRYDAYTFVNASGSTQCVTASTTTACAGANFIFVVAYSSFCRAM